MILDHNRFENNNWNSPSLEDEAPSKKMVEENDEKNNEFPKNTQTIDSNHLDDLNIKASANKWEKMILQATWNNWLT